MRLRKGASVYRKSPKSLIFFFITTPKLFTQVWQANAHQILQIHAAKQAAAAQKQQWSQTLNLLFVLDGVAACMFTGCFEQRKKVRDFATCFPRLEGKPAEVGGLEWPLTSESRCIFNLWVILMSSWGSTREDFESHLQKKEDSYFALEPLRVSETLYQSVSMTSKIWKWTLSISVCGRCCLSPELEFPVFIPNREGQNI